PDVNICGFRFTVNEDRDVVYGLVAIKGLGVGPVDGIVCARVDGNEPVSDLFDVWRRVDVMIMDRRSLEALIRAGALDQLGPNRSMNDRATLLATLPDALQAAEQDARNAEAGMGDLFGGEVDVSVTQVAWHNARPWKVDVRLQGEK